ncbi:MAG TPA: DUF2076 domain-containing protein [Xanthobacteraceae bacterium]|nr:DUF2076 domain-containing protein [Xanthobacteraceae bacterium]
MTPQERQRVAELFERLARLENSPREREAEELIMEGLRYAPNSPYAMVQTILVQEEALERANARIQELEMETEAEPAQPGGFLDNLRGAFGGNAGTPRRVSVPTTGGRPMGVPRGFRSGAAAGNQPQPQQEIGRGSGFLGQAASIAAGVVVGSMVADALRGQFGSETTAAKQEQAAADQEAQTDQASVENDQSYQDDGGFETADVDGGFDMGGGDFG